MRSWPAPPIPSMPPEDGTVTAWDSAARALVTVTDADPAVPFRLYVCGITPYDATHLGHAATYVAFDLLHRVVKDTGRTVCYAQNVTDVDDPLLERAAATGVDWAELADEQIDLFREDMAALRVIPPDHYLGVRETVEWVTEAVTQMIDRDRAYPVASLYGADTYAALADDPNLGSIAHLDRPQMLELFAERGGDPDRVGKRDALDALVWRHARTGEPSWLGGTLDAGRPGWHIECAVIAQRTLGLPLSVQGGGSDLAFPHHEMCAAHATTGLGHPLFAHAYVHTGMVGLHGEKMSKSLGNLVFVSELRRSGADPMAIRLALLAHHYRSDWEWSDGVLTEAGERLARWRRALAASTGAPALPALAEVRSALRHDLDAPRALAAIDAWAEAGGDDASAPAAIGAAVDALLGIR